MPDVTSPQHQRSFGPRLLKTDGATRRALGTALETVPRSNPEVGAVTAHSGLDRWSNRTVLVTGAGGFIASWICKALADAGSSVIGIVRDSVGEQMLQQQGILDRVILLRGSITDYALVERALNEYEVD
ncbi:MAG TPA: NAD-dependent epimerase/dehydratase family protein, partial [Chloroflexota bacterium]|nr:NAD-dependent epimerase/dehydratase family protein [Chloroflexota bacterium]